MLHRLSVWTRSWPFSRIGVCPLRIVAAALLLHGCTSERLTLADTAALDQLGGLRLGMGRAEATRIADEHTTRTERISCRSHPGYEFCSRMKVSADSEKNLGLLFQGDTLRALSWTRTGEFASLRRRYAEFGEPRWARAGRPPRPADILAVWVSTDSTVVRDAVCHDGRSRPVCKIVAASTTPAQMRARAAKESAR
ncbi:MAG: hypothetical protein AVDCRST_MAG89-4913 [uncultured Gemmatimonadetes bacterium]|uniref:Uncharacterized protein n=1 Tax=uncultured Gemmatimonadota bacterium TaxID=203437 RepID=A0A6J4N5I8_9BACT|nr:MAG: hypothetical protein AVDCRST_MAG89-4913 [uncultured Gemmatimonadota bacterium]